MIDAVNRPCNLRIRALAKTLLTPILRLQGFRVMGGEHLPEKPMGCMLIANHAAFADSVYLICAVRPRFTICGAKAKYFEKPKTRRLFTIANILKVENRDQFLRDCRALLDAGEVILIYPEMGRNPEGMGEFKTWAAEVALDRDVPVIPCYLHGTTQGQEGPKRLFVGQPMKPEGDVRGLTERFREAITALMPQDGGDR